MNKTFILKKRRIIRITLILAILIVWASCHAPHPGINEAKQEVLRAEDDFMKRVASQGIQAAFLHYADEDAVLVRNNRVFRGKAAIAAYFAHSDFRNIRLTWKPDFVDVSDCGDLAYTWGSYEFSATDSTGGGITSNGIFHTVWKKQNDGNWKYVYD